MFYQCLLLLLLFTNLFIGPNAGDVNPLIRSCVFGGSDNTASYTKIVSNGKCRQPFEVVFILERGSNYYINTEIIASPLDNSEIWYSFGDCELSLKAHSRNDDIWFELLKLGKQQMSGKRIDRSFIIKLYDPNFASETIELISKSDSTVYASSTCSFSSGGLISDKGMTFKQEVKSGDPNLALVLYKTGDKYFGGAGIDSGSTFGSLPPFPTTTILPTTKSSISITILPTTKSSISTSSANPSSSISTSLANSSSRISTSSANPSSSISMSLVKSAVSAQTTSTQFNSTTLRSTAVPTKDKQEKNKESLFWVIIVAIASLLLILFSLCLCFLNLRRKYCRKNKKEVTSTHTVTSTQETTQTQSSRIF